MSLLSKGFQPFDRPAALVVATALAALAGCDATRATASHAQSDVQLAAADAPAFPAPTDFVAAVSNPYFPLVPGTVFHYRSETDEGVETGVVTVTDQTRMILGVAATVVHDQVFVDGELAEDTYDWYAQDRWGNVWYLGEASCEIEDGACASTEGSWEAGVDDAEAGIFMWADPGAHIGKNYRQEFLEDVAEDMAKVLHVSVSASVPAGDFDDCIETMDWTPLEPGAREHKFYCAGTGLVLEVQPGGGNIRNELTSITTP